MRRALERNVGLNRGEISTENTEGKGETELRRKCASVESGVGKQLQPQASFKKEKGGRRKLRRNKTRAEIQSSD